MNARQKSKLNMYRTVELHCNNNSALIAGNTAFSDSYSQFINKIVAIQGSTTEQEQKITGFTTAKSVAKKALSETASIIAGFIFAYASANNNYQLKEKVNYTYSELLAERDEQLVPVCSNILNSANDNLAALTDYGITAATVSGLQSAMEAYNAAVPANTNATSIRKAYGQALKQLIKETDVILKERMDKLVSNFADTDPGFVASYKNARSIIEPGYRKNIKKEAEVKAAA